MLTKTVPIKRLLLQRAAAAKSPISGNFELTPRCNLGCKMCYVRLSPAEMAPLGRERSAGEWIDLGREVAKAGTLFLLLTGGEPLLRQDFEEIYRGLSGLGMSLSINTNGTLATAAHAALFRELPPAAVNLTLYGASRESYQALCGDPTAYDRAVDTVEALREAGVNLRLNFTATPSNKGDLEALWDFASRRELQLRVVSYLFPPLRRSNGEFRRHSPEEAGILSARSQWLTEDRKTVLRRAEDLAKDLPCRTPLEDCQLESRDGLRCLAGSGQYWIAWNGDMYPCGMLPEPVTKPFEEGFLPAWKRLTERTDRLPIPSACDACRLRPLCPACAAVSRTETGSTAGIPEYACRLTESYCKELVKLAGLA